jgi:hypothetical protein
MIQNNLDLAIKKGFIEWQKHALERMIERSITRDAVKQIISLGEIIEDYHDDKPFPSALIMGWHDKRPIHAVVAYDDATEWLFVITAYEPDSEHFESDFKTRRTK